MKHPSFLLLILFLTACSKQELPVYGPISGVPFNEVKLNDSFWLPKIETNRLITIPASFAKCEEMGRMDNFLIAGGKLHGQTRGEMPFDDTDVYKIIEGASYSLATTPDARLDAYLDSVIAIIKTGQEPDGYLTTYKSIDTTYAPAEWCPPGGRWQNLSCSHELYNSGHMIEAAVAHYQATGKRNFLDIAIKNADLLVSVFGNGKNPDVPGHQIVEMALVKLYQVTRKKEYLDLARHFLDYRGDSTKRQIRGPYNQDHKPVVQQDEAVGHAVRALYMYSGMTDIAALFNDQPYQKAVEKIWDNMVSAKLYITGGLGARHEGEAFGNNYELPNLTAYNETCAAIANVYWNYRMFLLHGDAKYMDVLERSLYNGVISGVGLDGRTFFYPNPLACDMQFKFNSGGSLIREPWFDCSCCPTNLCRFIPSVPGYVYARKENGLYVNLFAGSSVTVLMNKKVPVTVIQETEYPWKGSVTLTLYPEKKAIFALYVRIPGWARNEPVPGDLYTYKESSGDTVIITLNGSILPCRLEKGYAVIEREWSKADELVVSFPMNVHRIKAHPQVADNRGKVALERGPVVYCFEEIDNKDSFDKLILSDSIILTPSYMDSLPEGTVILKGKIGAYAGKEKSIQHITAVPYFLWNNRGANRMEVWIKEQ